MSKYIAGKYIDWEKEKNKQVGGTHYVDMEVQPWDAMQSWMTPDEFKGFLRGSVIKYIARAGHKDDCIQDLKKAMHYLEKLIEVSNASA